MNDMTTELQDFDLGEASESKIQLILAGERLFAQRGIEGASLREIASSAGHGNNNAVRYHFGSKQGLVQAIFRFRVAQMETVRARFLAQREAEGLLGDARSLLEVIMLPYFILRAADGTMSYAGFMLQYLLQDRPRGVVHAADEVGTISPALKRTIALLQKRINYLDEATIDRRILSAMIVFIGAIISAENREPALTPREYRDMIDDTLDQCVALMTMPERRRSGSLLDDPEVLVNIIAGESADSAPLSATRT